VGIFRRGTKNTSTELDPGIPATDVEGSGVEGTADVEPATRVPSPKASRRGGPFDRQRSRAWKGAWISEPCG